MKTTLKEICNTGAVDVTHYSTEELYKLSADERGFKQIAYSAGGYGVNGLLVEGNTSHTWYKVISRTNAIFILA